jgi:hypothetical protein
MTQRPFRFLHSGGFRLHQPAGGIAEVPQHLRDAMMDAPYLAAAKVFDAALVEEVAFVVLCGDLLQAEWSGPRGPLFLLEQFERLAAREIPVYWAGGALDPPDAWPAAVPLPGNVHRFSVGRTSAFVIERDGAPLARVLGASRDGDRPLRPGDFDPDPTGLPTIAVGCGAADTAALQARGIAYWALGGQGERTTLLSAPCVVHDAGSPQGRWPAETGVHGCTLVQCEAQQMRTSLVPTDVLRWHDERIALDGTATREGLEAALRSRVQALTQAAPQHDLLIHWTIAGDGGLVHRLHREGLAAELLAWLRDEFGRGRPAAWSVDCEIERTAMFPAAWYEQENLRGDYLRLVRQRELNPGEPLGLEAYLAEADRAGPLAAVAAPPHPAARQRILREAAMLGVELLSGEEPQS